MFSQLKSLQITKKPNLEKFESILDKIWGYIPMELVRAACTSFTARLRCVIQANDGRIE